jgi:hypothetical protein
MPIFSEVIAQLEAAPITQRLFFPSDLSVALRQYASDSAVGREWGIIVACLVAKNTTGVHRLLPCLKQFRHDIRDVIARVYHISVDDLLNDALNEGHLAINQNDHLIVIDYFLFKLGVITHFNSAAIDCQRTDAYVLAKTLNLLINSGLSDHKTISFVFNKSDNPMLLQSFWALDCKKLLNAETACKLRLFKHHNALTPVLKELALSQTIQLTQSILDRIFMLSEDALSDLGYLITLNDVSQIVFDTVLQCMSKEHYQTKQSVFDFCQENYVLNSQVACLVIQSGKPSNELIEFLSKLQKANLLSHTVVSCALQDTVMPHVLELLLLNQKIPLTLKTVIAFSKKDANNRELIVNIIQQHPNTRLSDTDVVELLNNDNLALERYNLGFFSRHRKLSTISETEYESNCALSNVNHFL